MNPVIKGFLSVIMSFLFIVWAKGQIAIIYSETDSLPYHYFLAFKTIKPKKGHYTMCECPWYEGKVIKEIAGVSGDEIIYDADGNIHVGGILVGVLKEQTHDGRVLTPLKVSVIQDGFIFLKGDHERSFDSRYAEMGLVSDIMLEGRLVGVW